MARAAIDRALSRDFPWGILAVNLLGSLAIGVVAARVPEEWRWVVGTGFLGGFTTFSAWSIHSLAMAQQGAWTAFSAFAVASPVAGLALAWAGLTWFAR